MVFPSLSFRFLKAALWACKSCPFSRRSLPFCSAKGQRREHGKTAMAAENGGDGRTTVGWRGRNMLAASGLKVECNLWNARNQRPHMSSGWATCADGRPFVCRRRRRGRVPDRRRRGGDDVAAARVDGAGTFGERLRQHGRRPAHAPFGSLFPPLATLCRPCST